MLSCMLSLGAGRERPLHFQGSASALRAMLRLHLDANEYCAADTNVSSQRDACARPNPPFSSGIPKSATQRIPLRIWPLGRWYVGDMSDLNRCRLRSELERHPGASARRKRDKGLSEPVRSHTQPTALEVA